MDAILTYLGGGYLSGVPARDLTQGDWDGLPSSERRAVLSCGLYEAAGGKKGAAALAEAVEQNAAAEPAARGGGS